MEESNLIVFWSPYPLASDDFCMDFFASALAQYGDIQCLHCKNVPDRRALQLMHHADLVVIVLRQNVKEIADYFKKESVRLENCMYLIINYFPEKDMDLDYVARVCRVERKRVVCVPYNTAYQEAARMGKQKDYIESDSVPCIFQARMDFRRELLRAVHCTRKALESSAI